MSKKPVILETRVVNGSGGGPDKTIMNSPRFLKDDYRTLCAYMHPPGDPGFHELRCRAKALGAPLVSVEDRGPFDWRVASHLLGLCRRERVAIWHGHDYKSNALGVLLRRFWPMRLVTTVHGWVAHTRRTPAYYALDRFCLPRYEKVICVSQDLYEQAVETGVLPARCLLIENGIHLEEYSRKNDVRTAKRGLGFADNRLLVGAIGRLSPEKGFDVLIRAIEQLLKSGLDVELAIVGEGEQKPELQQLAAGLGLGDRVHFPGYQPDTIPWYEAMDVFALSSFREGLPNVLLEAMALEVCVVASRVAGVPKLVRHNENGLLTTAGDVAGLTEALGRLLRDSATRARLAKAGRSTVEARYSFAARMEKIRAVYDSLMSTELGAESREPAIF